jgi:DNA-binding CsgD family transcriptional regulator
MRLRLEQFSRVVASIHRAALAPEHWPDSLAAMAALAQSWKGGIFELHASSLALASTIARVGHDEAVQRAYERHYYSVDPTMPLGLAQPPLTPLAVYDHFDKRARSRSEYFSFARASGFGDTLGFSTPEVAGKRLVVTLHRPFDAAPFGDEAKELTRYLATQFHIAQRVGAHLGELREQQAQVAAALDRACAAVWLVDSVGAIRHLNAAAREALARRRGISARHGRLYLMDPGRNAAFAAALRQATRERGRCSVLLLSVQAPDDAELVVAPLEPQAGAWTDPLALVALPTRQTDAEIAARLREIYRLTSAEARVAALVARGHVAKEIAAALGVREPTVRTQLQSIFAKTGTTRQAQLVRLCLRGALLRRAV